MKFIPTLNLKTKLRDFGSGFSDMIGIAFQIAVPGGGSAICFAVGKFVVGAVLACITFAVVMRLLWRRKRADHVRYAQRLPVWARLVAALIALIGSGVFVEMVKLPVRFDQPGFAMSNWLVVIASMVLINIWCRSLLTTWLNRKSSSTSLVEKQ